MTFDQLTAKNIGVRRLNLPRKLAIYSCQQLDDMKLNLEKAVESTTSRYCTDSQTLFPNFSPHRMGDTISAKNQEKESVNQHINNSRYDSTAFSRLKDIAQYFNLASDGVVSGIIASMKKKLMEDDSMRLYLRLQEKLK